MQPGHHLAPGVTLFGQGAGQAVVEEKGLAAVEGLVERAAIVRQPRRVLPVGQAGDQFEAEILGQAREEIRALVGEAVGVGLHDGPPELHLRLLEMAVDPMLRNRP